MSFWKCTVAVGIGLAAIALALQARRVFAQSITKEPTTMPAAPSSGPLSFTVKDIDGGDFDLASLRGKVVLIVNVASRCGFTKQYAGLESLYEKYRDQGLVVVGFPANNFGGQEPGTDAQIKEFCTSKYSVSFPVMSKISVKGDDKHPVYKALTDAPAAGEFAGDIGWNFTKFVVDRNGNVIGRFASGITPEDPQITSLIEKALATK
jgi:glutathione peroxidase